MESPSDKIHIIEKTTSRIFNADPARARLALQSGAYSLETNEAHLIENDAPYWSNPKHISTEEKDAFRYLNQGETKKPAWRLSTPNERNAYKKRDFLERRKWSGYDVITPESAFAWFIFAPLAFTPLLILSLARKWLLWIIR